MKGREGHSYSPGMGGGGLIAPNLGSNWPRFFFFPNWPSFNDNSDDDDDNSWAIPIACFCCRQSYGPFPMANSFTVQNNLLRWTVILGPFADEFWLYSCYLWDLRQVNLWWCRPHGLMYGSLSSCRAHRKVTVSVSGMPGVREDQQGLMAKHHLTSSCGWIRDMVAAFMGLHLRSSRRQMFSRDQWKQKSISQIQKKTLFLKINWLACFCFCLPAQTKKVIPSHKRHPFSDFLMCSVLNLFWSFLQYMLHMERTPVM